MNGQITILILENERIFRIFYWYWTSLELYVTQHSITLFFEEHIQISDYNLYTYLLVKD